MAQTIDGIRWWERPDGFLYARIPDGGSVRTVLYHRYVVEKALGRRLQSTEEVAFVDGDRRNTEPGNLEVRPRAAALRERLAAIPPGANRGYKHRKHRPKGAPKRPPGRPPAEKRP